MRHAQIFADRYQKVSFKGRIVGVQLPVVSAPTLAGPRNLFVAQVGIPPCLGLFPGMDQALGTFGGSLLRRVGQDWVVQDLDPQFSQRGLDVSSSRWRRFLGLLIGGRWGIGLRGELDQIPR